MSKQAMPGWLASATGQEAAGVTGVRPDGSRFTAGDKLNVFLMYGAVLAGAEGAGTRGPRASALRPGAGPAAKRIFGLP